MVWTMWAYSSGSPRRLGKGMLRASSVLTGSGRLARRGVLNSPREEGGEGREGEGGGGGGGGGRDKGKEKWRVREGWREVDKGREKER